MPSREKYLVGVMCDREKVCYHSPVLLNAPVIWSGHARHLLVIVHVRNLHCVAKSAAVAYPAAELHPRCRPLLAALVIYSFYPLPTR